METTLALRYALVERPNFSCLGLFQMQLGLITQVSSFYFATIEMCPLQPQIKLATSALEV